MRSFADGDQENGVGDGELRGALTERGSGGSLGVAGYGFLGDGFGSGGASLDHAADAYQLRPCSGDGRGTGGCTMTWD